RLPVYAGDSRLLAGELLGRMVAECCDHLRPDQLDLAEEPPFALVLLVRHRVAVARRPALQCVRYIDVRPREPDAGEQSVEQLPAPAAVWPKLGCSAVPCPAKTENCFCTFEPPQSGHGGSSPFRTSSSKCDSHCMQTYS